MRPRLALAVAAVGCALAACDAAKPSTPTAPSRTTVKPQAPLAFAVRVLPSDQGDDHRRVEVDVTQRAGARSAVFTVARAVDAEVGACRPERIASLERGQTATVVCDARITGADPSFDLVAQLGAVAQPVHVRLRAGGPGVGGASDAAPAAGGAPAADPASAASAAPSTAREVTLPDGQRIRVVGQATPAPSTP